MIKLKDLLMEKDGTVWIGNETYPAHTNTALHWIRNKHIPLTPKVVESIVGKKIPVKSFHITGPESLHRVKNVLTFNPLQISLLRQHEDLVFLFHLILQ